MYVCMYLSLSHQSFRGEFCDTFKGNIDIDNCQPTWEWVKTSIHLDSDRFSICFGMSNETGNDVPQIHWIIIVSQKVTLGIVDMPNILVSSLKHNVRKNVACMSLESL